MKNIQTQKTGAHRHDHNPFALAHAVNIAQDNRPDLTSLTKHPTAEEIATERLFYLYKHITDSKPTSPGKFRARLDGDLESYTVLLDLLDHLPTAKTISNHFRECENTLNTGAGLQFIADQMEYYDPAPLPPTKEEVSKSEEGLTTSQKNYKRIKERMSQGLGMQEFLTIFNPTLKTELFIAAHRWPQGKASCPICASTDTSVFKYQYTDQEPKPGFLSNKEVGPKLGWDCSDCDEEFTVTTGTIMAEPNLPPVEWMTFTLEMIRNRMGTYEYDLTDVVGQFHGIVVTKEAAETMRNKIRSVLSFTKPRTRQLVGALDAIKMLIRTETVEEIP